MRKELALEITKEKTMSKKKPTAANENGKVIPFPEVAVPEACTFSPTLMCEELVTHPGLEGALLIVFKDDGRYVVGSVGLTKEEELLGLNLAICNTLSEEIEVFNENSEG